MVPLRILLLFKRIQDRLSSDCYLLFYRKHFKHVGHQVRIYSNLRIIGHPNITIGDKVCIEKYSWIEALPLTGELCSLVISDGAKIGHFNHIYCTKSIIIEDDVLTADKVYISDNAHDYSDIKLPIKLSPIKQLKSVVIGAGSWLGENVAVIGASVGKHCVIGANSVVTHDIPDYSIAVGAPARVIKRWNFSSSQWEPVK